MTSFRVIESVEAAIDFFRQWLGVQTLIGASVGSANLLGQVERKS